MILSFPVSPEINDKFTSDVQSWQWDGISWNLIPILMEGPPGVAGIQGVQGDIGVIGPSGADSIVPGPTGANSTVPGPQGIQGDIGSVGPQGIIGETGADSTVPGPIGIQGTQGEIGGVGPQGSDSTIPGPQGVQGIQGDAGTVDISALILDPIMTSAFVQTAPSAPSSYGPNLEIPANWILGGGANWSGAIGTSAIRMVFGAGNTIEQSFDIIAGNYYSATWTPNFSGAATFTLGTATLVGRTSDGTKGLVFKANESGSVVFRMTITGSTNKTISNIHFSAYNISKAIIIGGLPITRNAISSFGIGVDSQKTLKDTGLSNIALGDYSQNLLTSGINNIAIGNNTQSSLTQASYNIGIGTNSQKNLLGGSGNTAVGDFSQSVLTTGGSNTAVGASTQQSLTSGGYNTAIGYASQKAMTNGSNNTAIGCASQQSIIDGNYNTSVGYGSQQSLTSGTFNTAVGDQSMGSVSTGNLNTAIGECALYGLDYNNRTVTASRQTAIGAYACGDNAQPNDIVAIGYNARVNGLGSMALGSSSRVYGDNSVAIGYNSFAGDVNQVTFGPRYLSLEQLPDPGPVNPSGYSGSLFSARLYVKDVGGKTALMIQFPTGAPQQIAIQG